MSEKNNHGGKRDGAGRPTASSHIEHDNKIVERKLKASAEMGWEVLADSYPELMRKAIETAMGSEKIQPNITLLKTLLELMVKVSGSEPSSNETVTDALVKGFIEDVRASRTDNQSVVEESNGASVPAPNSGYIQWANPDPKISGMGQGIQFGRS